MIDKPPGSIEWTPGAELTLSAGPIEIKLCADPLETLLRTHAFDAVVSSDDAMLSASGGVSKLIRDLGGEVLQREAAAQVPLPVGSIAVTSGGNLSVKYVIHAVTLDLANNVWPTTRTIHQLIRAILSRCEALAISRLAIPALGTGSGRLDPIISAEVIARGLREHALNPTALRAVLLPIPRQPVRAAFARALMRPMLKDITIADLPMPGSSDTQDLITGDESLSGPPMRPSLRIQSPGAPIFPGANLIPGAPGPPRARPSSSLDSALPNSLFREFFSRLLRRGAQRESSVSTAPGLPPAPAIRPDELSIANDGARPLLNARYVLLEEVGRGGMAVVYLSWDLVLRRSVAIKVLRPDNLDSQSLKREAAAAFELTHDSIIRMYHFEPGNRARRSYLVMEYVPWPSGEKWIADAGVKGLPIRPVVDVGTQICRAVAYAHSRNVLHLDIKPSNFFIDPGGEQAKLGDFGLARVSNAQGAAMQLRPAGRPRTWRRSSSS